MMYSINIFDFGNPRITNDLKLCCMMLVLFGPLSVSLRIRVRHDSF